MSKKEKGNLQNENEESNPAVTLISRLGRPTLNKKNTVHSL